MMLLDHTNTVEKITLQLDGREDADEYDGGDITIESSTLTVITILCTPLQAGIMSCGSQSYADEGTGGFLWLS